MKSRLGPLAFMTIIGMCSLWTAPSLGAITDTTSMVAGYRQNSQYSTSSGFVGGSIGSLSPAITSDAFGYAALDDTNTCGPRGGCTFKSSFSVTGFKADPGQAWLTSVAAHGATRTGATAGYSYSNGVASWTWAGLSNQFGFLSGNTYPVTVVHDGLVGYIDAKYVVVGVTYAPPGPSTNTSVSYANSTLVGNTVSLSNSFASGFNFSIALSSGYAWGVSNGSVTTTYSTTTSVTTKNASSVTTSVQVQQGEKTFGTDDYFSPVNHDYDTIWVWLNPAVIVAIYSNSVVWKGYGYDMADQPSPDIVGIQLGYLNGDFGAIPPDIQASFNRAWAANQIFGPGEGPALTSADLAYIASTDPFSAGTYGTNFVGYSPPSPETSDHRFTLTTCATSSSFSYLQAAPSQAASIYSCSIAYSTTSTQAQTITSSAAQTYSLDQSFALSGFVAKFNVATKLAWTLTWVTESQTSGTDTSSSSAAFSVQGPPCNNVQLGVGPCVPVYDSTGTQPTQYEIYQDNFYGTFMFAPVHYY